MNCESLQFEIDKKNPVSFLLDFFSVRFWKTESISPICKYLKATNQDSQIPIGRLGAEKVAEEDIAYFGETRKLNFIYEITRENWKSKTL